MQTMQLLQLGLEARGEPEYVAAGRLEVTFQRTVDGSPGATVRSLGQIHWRIQ
jgi:hypothetical protein